MSQESPEQQIPLALSPTALAQRDANMVPTEYPKSIGKKTLDARYARDARQLRRIADFATVTSDLSFVADDEARPLNSPFSDAHSAFHCAGSGARRTRTCPPRRSS